MFVFRGGTVLASHSPQRMSATQVCGCVQLYTTQKNKIITRMSPHAYCFLTVICVNIYNWRSHFRSFLQIVNQVVLFLCFFCVFFCDNDTSRESEVSEGSGLSDRKHTTHNIIIMATLTPFFILKVWMNSCQVRR